MTEPTPEPASTPAPPSTPADGNPTRASRQGQMVEEVYFDGPISLWGRMSAFLWAALVVALVVAVPIVAAIARKDSGLPWYVYLILILIALAAPACVWVQHKTTRYKLTNYRVDFERGILSTRIDSIELWHIDDIAFRQGLIQRLVGVGTIELVADDKSNPRLLLRSLPGARQLFETLKSRIIAAKRERGLLELDQ
jgi:uncharacterized membrane protein YdbT with pleckstrin-like domain